MPLSEAEVVSEPVRTPAEIARVAALAQQIWHEYYTPIIGATQVEYMLQHFQSAASIAANIREGFQYFLVRLSGHQQDDRSDSSIGYYSILTQPTSRQLLISKLYLIATMRGMGLGRLLLDRIALLARNNGLDTVWLTVNKNNPALHTYLRCGFVNKGSIVKDIGGGFVMDDFQLERVV